MEPTRQEVLDAQEKDAFAAHQAIMLTERARPELRVSPAWIVIRQTAYEQYANAEIAARGGNLE